MSANPAGGSQQRDSPVWRMLLALTCLAVIAATGCRHSSGLSQEISIQAAITPQPSRLGDAMVSVQLSDRNGIPLAQAAIMVEAEMNHPGMKPFFKAAAETAPGHYQAPITFDMAGDWVVLLHITLADGNKIERQIDVRGVQPH